MPHISAETIDFHYGKHHSAYVEKLNKLTKGTKYAKMDLVEVIETCEPGEILNNAGQVWNHTFYWHSMGPNAGGKPTGNLHHRIEADFGSFEDFKEKFNKAASGHFGSGWAWLSQDESSKKLQIQQTHDGDSLARGGKGKPILACDVWEHAYYIDFRNDRAKYLENWWNVVNWEFANNNLVWM